MGIGAPTRPPAGGKGAMNVPGVRNPGMGGRPPVIQPGPGVGPRPPIGGKGAGAVRPPAGGKGAMGPVQLELIQKQLAGMPTQGGSYPFQSAPIEPFDPSRVTTTVLGPSGNQNYTNEQMLNAYNAYLGGGTSSIPQDAATIFGQRAIPMYGAQQLGQYLPTNVQSNLQLSPYTQPLQSQLQPIGAAGANALSIARPAGPLQPSPLAGLSALARAQRTG